MWVLAPRVLAFGRRDRKADCVDLTQREKAILDFERTWWTEPGPKEMVIAEKFELSSERYSALLAELLESEAAESYDPLVVKRLRRMRERRRRARLDAVATIDESSGS